MFSLIEPFGQCQVIIITLTLAIWPVPSPARLHHAVFCANLLGYGARAAGLGQTRWRPLEGPIALQPEPVVVTRVRAGIAGARRDLEPVVLGEPRAAPFCCRTAR